MFFLLLILGIVFMPFGTIAGFAAGRGTGKPGVGMTALVSAMSFMMGFVLLFTDALQSLIEVNAAPDAGFNQLVRIAGYACWCSACMLFGYTVSRFVSYEM